MYYIINNDVIIGKVNILEIETILHADGKTYTATARYSLFNKNAVFLIRAGSEIGLTKSKEKVERDFSDKQKKKEIKYKKTIISQIDKRQMILIPRGKFAFGSDNYEKDEFPRQILYLNDYYIDKYEVSNKEYMEYLLNTSAEPPVSWENNKYKDGEEDIPVRVNYFEAEAYAKWAGKKLPTEMEWEKAARGSDINNPPIYPWGNRYNAKNTNSIDFWNDKTIGNDIKQKYLKGYLPINMFENSGSSPFGVVNMSGNINEWTSSWYKAYEGNSYINKRFGKQVKVIRGGAWYSSRNKVRTSSREYGGMPNLYNDYAGFRCIKDPDLLDRQWD